LGTGTPRREQAIRDRSVQGDSGGTHSQGTGILPQGDSNGTGNLPPGHRPQRADNPNKGTQQRDRHSVFLCHRKPVPTVTTTAF